MNPVNNEQEFREARSRREQNPLLDFYSYVASVSNMFAIVPGATAYGFVRYVSRRQNSGREK